MNSQTNHQVQNNPNTARTRKSTCFKGLGILLLILTNFLVMVIYFNSTRNYNLHGKGLNLACQDGSLSPLDHWVCTDGRLNKTFFFYTDGSPYFLYRDLLSLPKYQNVSVGRMSRNLGLLDSGPSFRSSLIGRLDIDYADELSDFDNVFHQATSVTKHRVDARFYYHFPVVPNLGSASFDRVIHSPRQFDGIADLCRQYFLTQDFDSDLGCGNSIDCQFTSQVEATEYVNRQYRKHREGLDQLQKEVGVCLEEGLAGVDSIVVYQEKIDDLAHDWSTMHKIVLELHAKTKANLESLLDHFLEHRPDTLVVVYSDHGQTVVPWEGEYTNHGYNDGENKGFVLLFNPLLQKKSLLKESEVLATDLFSSWQQLIYGANVPKWKKEMPGSVYSDDPLEELKILRSRHLQMQSVLGQDKTATGIWSDNINSSLLGPQILERLGPQKLKDLNKEYRAFLESLEPQFENQVQQLTDPYKLWIYLLAALVLVADVLVIYYRVKQAPADESTAWMKVGLCMLVLFHICLACLAPIKIGTYPIFAGVFLLLAAALAFGYHRYKMAAQTPSEATIEAYSPLPARPDPIPAVPSALSPKLWTSKAFKLLVAGPLLLVTLRLLSWYFVKNETLRIVDVENVAHFLSKQIAVLGVLTVSCAVFYLFWCAVAETKNTSAASSATSTTTDSAEAAGLAGRSSTTDISCSAASLEATSRESIQSARSFFSGHENDSLCVVPEAGVQLPVTSISPLRSNLNNMILMINIALVLTMLLALGLYEYRVFSLGTLIQTPQMRTLVQVVYCLFALLLLGTGCVPTHSGRYVLVAAAFVFCAFWATHMNRILYSVLVLPVLIYIMRLAQQQKFIGWLSACMLILQFGLFTANNEEYLFAVSQRCLKRLPIEHPDQNILMTAVNAYCIKFATVILLNMFILTMETTAAFKHSSTILLAHLGMYLVSGKAITSHDEERHSFIIIVGANMLTPAFRLLLGKIHGQIRSLCGLSSKTS